MTFRAHFEPLVLTLTNNNQSFGDLMEISHPYIEKEVVDTFKKNSLFSLAPKTRALLMLYFRSLEDGYSKSESQTILLKFLVAMFVKEKLQPLRIGSP